MAVMLATSFLTPRQARRAAFVVLVISLVLMLAVLLVGIENNGSRRWINILGLSLQPSEFMKPAFVVIVAWLFAENKRRPDIPGNLFALILLGIAVALLIAEPDFGQTMLIAVAWGALFFMAGVPWIWIAGLGALGIGGMFAAYSMLPHVAARVDLRELCRCRGAGLFLRGLGGPLPRHAVPHRPTSERTGEGADGPVGPSLSA